LGGGRFLIEKIISGGQTGADMGGLIAARSCGIRTGGEAPKGYRTEKGNNYSLRDVYGLSESQSSNYEERTKTNIKSSDGTVIFSEDLLSSGTQLTERLCIGLDKPYFIYDFSDSKSSCQLEAFIYKYNVKILNVAGNRESVSLGIQNKVVSIIENLLFNVVDLYPDWLVKYYNEGKHLTASTSEDLYPLVEGLCDLFEEGEYGVIDFILDRAPIETFNTYNLVAFYRCTINAQAVLEKFEDFAPKCIHFIYRRK
jgi:hypothetical protein